MFPQIYLISLHIKSCQNTVFRIGTDRTAVMCSRFSIGCFLDLDVNWAVDVYGPFMGGTELFLTSDVKIFAR